MIENNKNNYQIKDIYQNEVEYIDEIMLDGINRPYNEIQLIEQFEL